jgi:hypothetical protein
MDRVSQKLIIIILSALLCTGALADGINALNTCRPETCCCTAMTSHAMADGNQMHKTDGCPPKTPITCCHITPLQPQTEVAVSSTRPTLPHQSLSGSVQAMVGPIALKPLGEPHRFIDNVPSWVMAVPLYLRTLAILC